MNISNTHVLLLLSGTATELGLVRATTELLRPLARGALVSLATRRFLIFQSPAASIQLDVQLTIAILASEPLWTHKYLAVVIDRGLGQSSEKEVTRAEPFRHNDSSLNERVCVSVSVSGRVCVCVCVCVCVWDVCMVLLRLPCSPTRGEKGCRHRYGCHRGIATSPAGAILRSCRCPFPVCDKTFLTGRSPCSQGDRQPGRFKLVGHIYIHTLLSLGFFANIWQS